MFNHAIVKPIRWYLLQILFWLVVFSINRLFFILYNAEEVSDLNFNEIAYTFVSAFSLDLSMASYYLGLNLIFLLIWIYSGFKLFEIVLTVINSLLVVFNQIISLAEFPIYDEWHTKLTRKAILYLSNPTEVINSATNKELYGGTIAIILTSLLFIFLYVQFVKTKGKIERLSFLGSGAITLILPAFIVLGIRGGVQQIPIQQSNAYFSKSNFLNIAAVNPVWNLGQSILENRFDEGTNPYKLYEQKEAEKIVQELYTCKEDSFPRILKTDKPNVVFVILESLSADMLKSLGGYDSIAPNLERMANEGVLFTQLFSSGTLSDQGHCSLLSGFPSQPSVVIMRQPDKVQKLPSIVSHFKNKGYYTAYYFGGQLEYGNIKSYIYFNQYDRITEGKDFDKSLPVGKLGYHDEFLFERIESESKEMKQPFFITAFTMSSHSPYDFPGERNFFNWGGDENMYLNGVHYSDKSIGKFMEQVKKLPWYKNTLFVFVSDHSHVTPRHHNFYAPRNRQIIGFLYGDVIKEEYRGMKVDKVGNHHDIPSTLLHQLNGDVKPFYWSKNLLNPSVKDFGFSADEYMNYFYNKENAYVYQYKDKRYLYNVFKSQEDSVRMFKWGSAYLQVLYQQYLDY